jgi:hypothetical protein
MTFSLAFSRPASWQCIHCAELKRGLVFVSIKATVVDVDVNLAFADAATRNGADVTDYSLSAPVLVPEGKKIR